MLVGVASQCSSFQAAKPLKDNGYHYKLVTAPTLLTFEKQGPFGAADTSTVPPVPVMFVATLHPQREDRTLLH